MCPSSLVDHGRPKEGRYWKTEDTANTSVTILATVSDVEDHLSRCLEEKWSVEKRTKCSAGKCFDSGTSH